MATLKPAVACSLRRHLTRARLPHCTGPCGGGIATGGLTARGFPSPIPSGSTRTGLRCTTRKLRQTGLFSLGEGPPEVCHQSWRTATEPDQQATLLTIRLGDLDDRKTAILAEVTAAQHPDRGRPPEGLEGP